MEPLPVGRQDNPEVLRALRGWLSLFMGW